MIKIRPWSEDSTDSIFAPTDTDPAKIVFAMDFLQVAYMKLAIGVWPVSDADSKMTLAIAVCTMGAVPNNSKRLSRLRLPQTIECLLTLMCARRFRVSQDNLFADFDTSASTFAEDVSAQAPGVLANG